IVMEGFNNCKILILTLTNHSKRSISRARTQPVSNMDISLVQLLTLTWFLVVGFVSSSPAIGQTRNLIQFKNMIQYKGYAYQEYWGYGCWCGKGTYGSNYFDATDYCCKIHDECYDKHAGGLFGCSPTIVTYDWTKLSDRRIQCTDSPGTCDYNICMCDKAAVDCYERHHNRECDVHNDFTLPVGIRAENLIDDSDDVAFNRPYDSSLSWRDLEWIRSITRLPLIVKGILHRGDAREAVRYGVQGIVVSNHGERRLDTSQSTIEALPDIIGVVRNEEKNYEMDVYVDGGVRRGTDILQALTVTYIL
ncbi:unnamed protein product, partial [Didymodactylos carnosus]